MIRLISAVIGVGLTATACLGGNKVYACSGSGGLYQVDVDLLTVTTLAGPGYGALSIAPGRNLDEVFVQKTSGAIEVFNTTSLTSAATGVSIGGWAFGEGTDGFWYINSQPGDGNSLVRFLPDDNTYPQTYLGSGAFEYAGDIATQFGQSWGSMRNGEIVKLDRTNGDQTLVGLAIPNCFGLAFTLDGRMFAGDGAGNLYQIDPNNATPNFIGNIGIEIYDMSSEASVPGPASLSLLTLAGLATARRRREV